MRRNSTAHARRRSRPASSGAAKSSRSGGPGLQDFFERHFQGWPETADTWSNDVVEELATLVQRLVCWSRRSDQELEYLQLKLDRSRLMECTEAWIRVVTPYGPGVLTFANSD